MMSTRITPHRRRMIRCSRCGISLVEVMFSIGVILIGLLGVMSILPLAGHRAQDAISLSVAAGMGDGVAERLSAQRWLSSGRMVSHNDAGALSPFGGGEPFCLDPAFLSGETFVAANPTGYDTRFFPFYKRDHDPTIDPSVPHQPGVAWPSAQPRMRRVGLSRQTATGLMSASEALNVADSIDDLLVVRPKQRDSEVFRPGFRATNPNDIPGGTSYGGRFATGEFSWIATVNPLPGGMYAEVSVVVIRNRQRGFSVPTTPGERTPEQNATDERLAYVTFASGFRGGAGGSVHLVSSGNTTFRIRSGDWIMLSKSQPPGPIPHHRWYRVAAVDSLQAAGGPERFSGTPAELQGVLGARLPGNAERHVWRRKIYLDGPDWNFAYPGGFADETWADNTFATLVEGVVSVTEHVIRLRAL